MIRAQVRGRGDAGRFELFAGLQIEHVAEEAVVFREGRDSRRVTTGL